MWNGTELKPLGITRLIVKNPKSGKKFSIEFVVVNDNLTPIIGARTAQQMKLLTVHADNFIAVPPPDVKVNEGVDRVMLKDDLIQRYDDVFSRELGTLPGTVHLQVDEAAQPVITPPRRVPTALKNKFKDELDRLEKLGVLATVDEPTNWVSSVVVTTKKSGQLRVCIDPKHLNQALKRETYQLPVLDDLLPELSRAKVFSTVDLTSGYWHCVLDEDSSLLTTFSTPFGRYKWNRLPFGLCASSEIFQKRVNQALDRLDGLLNITDDILVYGVGETEKEANEDHDRKLEALLKRCRERGIALNKNKLRLRIKEVTFMGHVFTSEGLKIDPEKVRAVLEMPRPEDAEGIQRLNGFVNYLARFLPRLADKMEPLRRLARHDTEFRWTDEQENALEEIKKLVTDAPVLAYFEPNLELQVQCDASTKGLGAALMQNDQPIAYVSRALTPTEQRYAQIEKEMLAIVFALEKFNHYTYGRKVKVQSDHKPLESILKKPLASAPKRLQGMMMRLQKYSFDVQYKCGKDMHLADTLSRAYLPTTEHPSGAVFENVCAASFLPVSNSKLREIQQATKEDRTLQALKDVILTGWPEERKDIPAEVTPYFSVRDELAFQDGIIFRGQRIVVPTRLRHDMKTKLHASHLGAESCLRRARETVFWPGMSAEIKEMVAVCETCRTYENSQQKETLMPHRIPTRPWEQVGVDLFELDKKEYLITVDYYSNFWEVDKLPSSSTKAVVSKLKSHFARYGCPDRLVSDNGPQFSSAEFQKFAKDWDVEHHPSSPFNSKGNGKAESAVKKAKDLMRKARDAETDPHLAFLEYRNTPTQGMGSSPVQRFMNRRTRTLLPTTKSLLKPEVVSARETQAELKQRQETQARNYNRSARDLPPLEEGEVVRMKPFQLGEKRWKKGIVATKLDERSYLVETSDGGTYRRNRYHLKKTKEGPPVPEPEEQRFEERTEVNNPTIQVPSPSSSGQQATGDPSSAAKTPTIQETPQQPRPQRVRRPPTYLQDYVPK